MTDVNNLPVEKIDESHSFVRKTLSIVGAGAFGAGAGMLVGGPPGAILGAISGAVGQTGSIAVPDLVMGFLHDSSARRVKKAVDEMEKEAKLLGYDPNSLLTMETELKQKAHDLLFACLISAKDSFEEVKSLFCGRAFVRAIHQEIDDNVIATVQKMLKISDTITYRQHCLLALCFRKTLVAKLRSNDYLKSTITDTDIELSSLLEELRELWDRGLVAQQRPSDKGRDIYESVTYIALFCPRELSLTSYGQGFYNIMGLERIKDEDLANIAEVLSR